MFRSSHRSWSRSYSSTSNWQISSVGRRRQVQVSWRSLFVHTVLFVLERNHWHRVQSIDKTVHSCVWTSSGMLLTTCRVRDVHTWCTLISSGVGCWQCWTCHSIWLAPSRYGKFPRRKNTWQWWSWHRSGGSCFPWRITTKLVVEDKVNYLMIWIDKVEKVLCFEGVLETLLVFTPIRFFLELLEVQLACVDVPLPIG